MLHRGLILAVPFAWLVALLPAAAEAADAGGTLTVPSQVQASAGAAPMVQPSFTYPDVTPFCTMGVDFTWDGGAWLSEFPTKNGAMCVAGGINTSPPEGHAGAGAHQVCGSAGPYRDCKTVTIIAAANQAPASAKPQPAGSAPATASATAPPPTQAEAPAAIIPSDAPAPRAVVQAVNSLPGETRLAGLVLLAVGVVGLLAIVARRLLLRRRRATALPTPDRRR